MELPAMHIGQAAARADVTVGTLHDDERRGLIPRPPRTPGNYRLYDPSVVRRIHFIKRAQELGFTLDEIKELLELRVDDTATCADVRRRAEEKMDQIAEKIRSLESMRRSLERLVAACSGRGAVSDGPILEGLEEPGPARSARGRRVT